MRMRTGSRKQIWEMRNLHISEKKVDFFFFFCSQDSPLDQCSGITPGRIRGLFGVTAMKLGLAVCKEST